MRVRVFIFFAIAGWTVGARPLPSPALAARLRDPVEIFGIVHWGPNTFTTRQWGVGNESPDLVRAPNFDADQIVRACKAGGLQGLVIVAKHHDGMCLWPTKTTDYRIGWDYLGKMVAACRAHGLKHGFYVSPWDRNRADYGSPAYVDVFWRQVLEVTSGAYGDIWELWLDSANGGSGWYGGARDVRSIEDSYYHIDGLVRKVREYQPGVCVFFDRMPGDFHFPANEKGELDSDARATFREKGEPATPGWPDGPKMGDPNGRHFSQPECDLPLRAEWFYDKAHDGYTKTPAYLMKIYLRTVGNGATMNLGIAPTAEGRLVDEDVRALAGFQALRTRYFEKRVQSGAFRAGGSTVRLEEPFNVIVMREDLSRGEQIDGWELRHHRPDGSRITLESGRSIGVKRIRTLVAPVSGGSLELVVTASGGEPQPVAFDLYEAPEKLIREIDASFMLEMTDLKLVCEKKNGWNLRLDRSVDVLAGYEYADIVLSRAQPAALPSVLLDFAMPKYDIRHLWRPGSANARLPTQDGESFSFSDGISHIYSLRGNDDHNRLTVAFDGDSGSMRCQIGIREANARIRCRSWLFEGDSGRRTNAVVRVRLDRRDVHWSVAVEEGVRWSAGDRKVCTPSAAAYDPLYSTCYTLPADSPAAVVAEELEKARRLGCVRLDDGKPSGCVRVDGCPGDMTENRRRIAESRLLANGRAVLGNPLEWHAYETPECAAGNFVNALFGVIRLSMRMQHLSGGFPAMAEHWIRFQRRYSAALLKGWFVPRHPEAGYPVLEGLSESCRIVAGYLPGFVVGTGPLDRETLVVDGTSTGSLTVDCPRETVFESYDTYGIRKEDVKVKAGITVVSLPPSGYLRWQTEGPVVPWPKRVSFEKGVVSLANATVERKTDSSLGAEGYRLTVTASNGVTIASGGEAGLFYAEQTLAQLKGEDGFCRVAEITDRPAYPWRGVHLDVSRHFFDRAVVTNLLARMATLKFNVFHWHLTDDQGWRIPMRSYSRLNTVGATRNGPDYVYDHEPGVYGPFGYSEADIREIRAFAKARHIRIVPEVDLPGHSRAVLQAYPELFCVTNGTAPVRSLSQDTLCPGNDASLAFARTAIDRVCELFPEAEVIHVGGDECVRKTWSACARCQARMKSLGLKNEGDLQGWFMRQCVKYVQAHGRRALGWDDMLDGGLAAGSLVMSWRGTKGGLAAAAQGHEVVMCPDECCYFDYPPDLGSADTHVYMPWKCPRLPVEKVYAFDPCAGLPAADRKLVLGGQCNNWTEYTPTEPDLQWKFYPRAFAMAEALWCGSEKPGYADFRARACILRERYLSQNINCAFFGKNTK